MKLYLVQHAEACTKDIDPQRPLTEQGGEDMARLAARLKHSGMHVGRIIHSGKLRAKQTAEYLAQALAPGLELEESGLLNPDDNPKAFDWQSESWDTDTLVIGHLPFMAKLVSHLLAGDENRIVTGFTPGSVVCLESRHDEHWQLNWMLRPELC